MPVLASLMFKGKRHTSTVGIHLQFNFALLHLDANAVLGGQAFVAHVSNKTTCTVAAMLDLAAVGIVNDVFKIK